MLVAAVSGVGAAWAPAQVPAAGTGCLLGILCTPDPPSPSPSPSTSDGGGIVGGLVGGLLGGGSTGGGGDSAGGIPPVPVVATPDTSGTTFTLPAAQLGGSSLSFTGIPSVSLVTVPLADGSRTTVIRLAADSITIDGFVLDVRKSSASDRGVTNSNRMTLQGHVVAYLDSATATTLDGLGITLGADTPLPGDELPAQLLRVNLGLVGVSADVMTMTPSHLTVTAGGR